jgi:RNA polymerase primary sigma factor
MRLVRAVSFRYRSLGVPLDDLVQEGAIGLLTAVDQYDASYGTSFSTYAFWRIRAAVTHAVTAQAGVIRVPRPLLDRRRQVAAARARLAREREPSIADLVAATGLSRDQVVEALATPAILPLDQEGAGRPLVDVVAGDASAQPDAELIRHEDIRALRRAVRRLRPRKRVIVGRHYGLDGSPATLAEIGCDLDLSPERTRALRDEALRELAAALPAPAP